MEETLEENVPTEVKVHDEDQGTSFSLMTSFFLCV